MSTVNWSEAIQKVDADGVQTAGLRHEHPLAVGVRATALGQPMDRSHGRRELSEFFTPACPWAPLRPRATPRRGD
jgi:hypothetical protein